jgi:uncharacterized membrane protein YkvA (DUF1232 family)
VAAWKWIVVGVVVTVGLYALFVAYLVAAGRAAAAQAVARFVPDCVVFFRRIMADARIPRRKKLLLAVLVAYLASPIDLIPDFIPVAGHLDDAVIVAFVLRHVLRGTSRELIEEHWPGPPQSRDVILRLAGVTAA